MSIDTETLHHVLSTMFGKNIVWADYQTRQLHGGTLGDVQLVTGTAKTADGERLPYKAVRKTQKKWERYGDAGSWRREYDLYQSDLGAFFSDTFRRPKCYHGQMNEGEIQIWMEYVDGVTGMGLTGEMYEQAALELGRFQGKVYARKPAALQSLTNLSHIDYPKKQYLHYRSWNEVYAYIRSDDCEIPKHLCEMLIEIDENADDIFSRIEKLPVVLCHRDFWIANIFYCDGNIVLIDWDTTGWGHLGEDIASLIADEADVERMVEYYCRCVPAYYKGFSEFAETSRLSDPCIREMILIIFGYRLVEGYKFARSPDQKKLRLNTLQKIYEMRDINANH